MKNIKYYLLTLVIVSIVSCTKEDDEAKGKLEPISILLPTVNPAVVSKDIEPINYKVEITTDNYIDSVKIFFQRDSNSLGYSKSRDSLIRRDTFIGNDRANVKIIEGVYKPWFYVPVGKKMYMTFRFYRQIDVYRDPKTDSTDKTLSILVQ